MKQNIFMILLLFIGTIGSFIKGPFYGIAVYYLFAVLRPQYLWKWALTIDIRWSYYVAIATILALLSTKKTATPANFTKNGNIAMALLFIWITISYLLGFNHEASDITYNEYIKIFIMFFIGTIILRESYQVVYIFIISTIALGYIAFEMNSLYFLDGRMDIYHNGYSGLDNNGAGLMIAMGAPMAYFLWQGITQSWRWIFIFFVPLIIHAVLMSYSRGAMLALLISSPLILFRSVNKRSMMAIVIALIILVPNLAGKEIRHRFFSIDDYDQDASANSRFNSWMAAIRIAEDNPIFGVGPRNADTLSHEYGADVQGRTIHNTYLQTAADCGFPALGFYISAWFIAWRNLRGFQKKYATSNEHRLPYSIACGIEGAMVVFCIGAAFLSIEVFELPYLLILLAFQLPGAVKNSTAIALNSEI